MFTIQKFFKFVKINEKGRKYNFACLLSYIEDDRKTGLKPFIVREDRSNNKTAKQTVNFNKGKFTDLLVIRNTATKLNNRIDKLVTELKSDHNRKLTEINYSTLPVDETIASENDGTFL